MAPPKKVMKKSDSTKAGNSSASYKYGEFLFASLYTE